MSDVPPDVFPNVLSRLPAKCLLRFRCVCKVWCRIIDDPTFAKLHLCHQTEGDHLIFKNSPGTKLYILCLDNLFYSQTSTKTVQASPLMTSTHNSLPVPRITTFPMPSCNGLILISNNFRNVLTVWSPFTREAQELPPHTYNTPPNQLRGCISIGLGYDSAADDYKVVRIEGYYTICGIFIRWETLVYSLKLNSWRIINEDFPSNFLWPADPGVFVNGALHWITGIWGEEDEEGLILLTFDLATEHYYFLPLPNILSKPRGHSSIPMLDALGECLLLTWNNSVYSLDLYEGKYMWTKLFSFSGMELGDVRPIAYLKTKREVLLRDSAKKYFWFNIDKKSAKKVTIHGAPDCWSSQNFKPSLVRLSNSSGTNGSNNAAKGRSARKKKRGIGSLKLVLTTTSCHQTSNDV